MAVADSEAPFAQRHTTGDRNLLAKVITKSHLSLTRGFISDLILPSETCKRISRSLVMHKDKEFERLWRKHENIPL